MPSTRQGIIALRQKGLTRRQMAARLGVSLDLVGGYLHQLLKKGIIAPIAPEESLRRRWATANKVDVQAAQRMRLAGKSYKEIGQRFGVSGPTISRLIGSTVRVTPIQRRLIHLHSQGLSYDTIAAKMRKPEGTVSVVLARLVKKGLLPARRENPFPGQFSRRRRFLEKALGKVFSPGPGCGKAESRKL